MNVKSDEFMNAYPMDQMFGRIDVPIESDEEFENKVQLSEPRTLNQQQGPAQNDITGEIPVEFGCIVPFEDLKIPPSTLRWSRLVLSEGFNLEDQLRLAPKYRLRPWKVISPIDDEK